MKSVFENLPGVEMPVDDVLKRLAEMWTRDAGVRSDYGVNRASQLNLVLHIGIEVSLEQAMERFNTALDFAQRYPCRVVVLCPYSGGLDSKESTLFRAKLYSVCFVDVSLREQCCCEVLILNYPRDYPKYLESQLTLWVEADLPIYHWFVNVPASRIAEHYLGFLSKCRRVIYDSDVDGDSLASVVWPRSGMAHDLASARLLSVRQSLGQFLSSYDEKVILDKLENITITCRESFAGEASHLKNWLCVCSGLPEDSVLQERKEGDSCLKVAFAYGDEKYFSWSYSSESSKGEIRGLFSKTEFYHQLVVKKPTTSDALSEALFFDSVN